MRISLFFLIAISLFGCKENKGVRNIEAFYFPLEKLTEGKVYEYRSVGNPNDPPMYWHYKSMHQDGKWFLLGTAYSKGIHSDDPEFSPDQFVREERVGNGMVLADFYTYEKDPTGKKRQVQATIEAANVFPFEVRQPPGVLLSSIRWQPLSDSSTITLVRNRQFDRDTSIVFQEKKLAAVQFNIRELIDQEEVGHLELEYPGSEIYAKGVGLFFFSKDINEEYKMRYRLAKIYEMKAFEVKFGVKLGVEN